jgi:predicted permease
LSVASGLLFGLLPARQVWHTDAAQAMKGGTSSSPVLRHFSMRDVLLCVQITLCTLLVTGSFVAFRGMERSLHTPLGFKPEGVTIAETQLNMGGYTDTQSWPVQKRMVEAAAGLPAVSSAGLADHVMLDNDCCGDESVYRQGTTDFRSSNEVFDAHMFSVSPGYFATAGTRLLAGRDISWHDQANSPQVAVVNARFACLLFGNTPAVGRHFETFGGSLKEIVGVVEDGKYQTLTEAPQPAMFFALAQDMTSNDSALVVRSNLPPADIAGVLNRMMKGIDPNIPLTVRTWPDALDLALFPARAATGALAIMGLLAAMLAVTGIFGMAAYSVSRRMKELGIRVALGAQKVELMNAAIGRPLLLLCSGSALGLVAGIFATGLLRQIVYQANPGDPAVLVGAVCAMALLGFAASAIPARRALSIDPSSLMREE